MLRRTLVLHQIQQRKIAIYLIDSTHRSISIHFKVAECCVLAYKYTFNTSHVGKILQVLRGKVLAITCMMCATGINPCSTAISHIGMRFPQHSCHGKFRQGMLRRNSVNCIYQSLKRLPISTTDAFKAAPPATLKTSLYRVGFATDTQWVYFAGSLTIGDALTDLQHMRTEHHFITRLKMISIIFHKRITTAQT